MKRTFASLSLGLIILLSQPALAASLGKYSGHDTSESNYKSLVTGERASTRALVLEINDNLKNMSADARNKKLDQYQQDFEVALKKKNLDYARILLDIIGEWR